LLSSFRVAFRASLLFATDILPIMSKLWMPKSSVKPPHTANRLVKAEAEEKRGAGWEIFMAGAEHPAQTLLNGRKD
jgi:hypothetical protein